MAVGVVQAGVNVEVVKEAAVAGREPVVCLEAAAGVEVYDTTAFIGFCSQNMG